MSIQIAVELPDRLVERLDRLVAEGKFDNRSDAIRHAISALLLTVDRRFNHGEFAEGLAEAPDTRDELSEAGRLAIAVIEEEPWEPWW